MSIKPILEKMPDFMWDDFCSDCPAYESVNDGKTDSYELVDESVSQKQTAPNREEIMQRAAEARRRYELLLSSNEARQRYILQRAQDRRLLYMQSRAETVTAAQIEQQIEAIPHDRDFVSSVTNLNTIRGYRQRLAQIREIISASGLSDEEKQRLSALTWRYDADWELQEMFLEEDFTAQPTPPPPEPVVTPPEPVPPVAPPPEEPEEVVAVVTPPPEPALPPEPVSSLSERQITRLGNKINELEGRNTPEKVEDMSRRTAASRYRDIESYLNDLPEDPATVDFRQRAQVLKDRLIDHIYNSFRDDINTVPHETQEVSQLDDLRTIRGHRQKLQQLTEEISRSVLDAGKQNFLSRAISRYDAALASREQAVGQAIREQEELAARQAEIRRQQEAVRDLLIDADRKVNRFVELAMAAQKAEEEVIASAQVCSSSSSFRRQRESAVEAIESATQARQRAQEAVDAARQAVAALPAEAQTGLIVPDIPTDDAARIPDVNGLPLSPPFAVSQPEISGATMVVECDCHSGIEERTQANQDAFYERIANILNSRSFPETLVLIFTVDVKLNSDGYVTEVSIRASGRSDGTTGAEIMNQRGYRNQFYSIAGAICRGVRGPDGRNGRRIRGMTFVIRPGGGMSFQIVSE